MPKKAVPPVKRRALNMKTTEAVRERLEKAALESGRSLTHEVEYRLENSFAVDDRDAVNAMLVGGEKTLRIMRAVGAMIHSVETRSGRKIAEHEPSRVAARAGIQEIMKLFLPVDSMQPYLAGDTPEAEQASMLTQAVLLYVYFVEGRLTFERSREMMDQVAPFAKLWPELE